MLLRTIGVLLALGIFAVILSWDQHYRPSPAFFDSQKALAETLCLDKEREMPNVAFSTDGCTLWPNALGSTEFGTCCVRHDVAYWCGGTALERSTADNAFKACLQEVDSAWAMPMHLATRIFGHPMLPTPWRWGFGHSEYPRGYDSP